MSSEEKDMDLPVPAYLREYIDSHSGNPSYQSVSIKEPKENPEEIENLKIIKLTKMPDAQEAIKKARRQERWKVLNKIDNKLKSFIQGDDTLYADGAEDFADQLKEEVEEA